MGEEGFQDSLVPAGEQGDDETREEKDGESNGDGSSTRVVRVVRVVRVIRVVRVVIKRTRVVTNYRGNSSPLTNQREAASKKDEDESRREKSFFFLEDPTRSHLQVLGQAEGGADDGG